MARKLSGGLVGQPSVGAINVAPTAVVTAAENQDITLSPIGTASVVFTNNAQLNAQNDLRFADADSSNWVAFEAPATVASNVTWTLPSVVGTAGQVFTVGSGGTISWTDKTIALSNNTTDSSTYNITLTTASTGSVSTLTTSNTKLTFQPSTGTLFSAVLIGGSSAASTLTLRSTTNATKGRVIIDETTTSTSTSTGALTVSGGVGIGENLYAGGIVRFSNSTASTTTATGALVVTGGVGVGGTMTAASIVETSSIIFKENILPITGALDDIMKLSGVVYDRLDTKEREAGLIAEHVQDVFPDLVTKDILGNVVGIKYTKLIAYLIEAVKSLNYEIDQLKGQK